jgi:hypothetical protein
LLDWNKKVDWVIGNPPYKDGANFVKHTLDITNKGFGFLGSHNFINSFFLPKRLQELNDKGFCLSNIHIVQDKRWYGRYYFLIAQKRPLEIKLSWNIKTYQGQVTDN